MGGPDRYAFARDMLDRGMSVLDVLKQVDEEVRTAYWKAKDLPNAIERGMAGINLVFAEAPVASSPDEKEALLQAAKTLAYNLGSFTWPGWAEPGIAIGEGELHIGFRCAQLNLELAIELNRPPERLADAHWLVGAHHLARPDWPAAQASFRSGIAADDSPMLQGYLLLARLCAGDETARPPWDAMMVQMAGRSDGVVEQLVTAHQVFIR